MGPCCKKPSIIWCCVWTTSVDWKAWRITTNDWHMAPDCYTLPARGMMIDVLKYIYLYTALTQCYFHSYTSRYNQSRCNRRSVFVQPWEFCTTVEFPTDYRPNSPQVKSKTVNLRRTVSYGMVPGLYSKQRRADMHACVCFRIRCSLRVAERFANCGL